MAKKRNIKPFMDVKHAFVESLDEYITQVLFLRQAVGTALALDLIKEPAKSEIRQALDAVSAATDSTEF